MPSVTQKIIDEHLVERTDGELALRIDQTLTQDATGTLVMLELESMDIEQVQTELSVQYVDHNLLQEDFKNPDDHIFLKSACDRYGVWYSRPGNGVSHPLHMEYFGVPGKTLLGSDSHTPAAGAIGMLAIGSGGIDVALAMAGEPYYLKKPLVWGVELHGVLPEWVSAKDIILEMLRRHGVKAAKNCIFEYFGPGLECLSAMDRHVIANMGTELGATSTVFPSDNEVKRFFHSRGRKAEWKELLPDADATYDKQESIDLSGLEPLIALPSSPENVVPVRDVAGEKIYQSYIGSSANPGYRDFAVAAKIVNEQEIHPDVSFDINPTSRSLLQNLIRDSHLQTLVKAGARIHQAGCNGCIGMGQAPATEKISLRTVPRNFPGRSGTKEDKVYLVSPETATASAITGLITDPRTLDIPYPNIQEPELPVVNRDMFVPPPNEEDVRPELRKGPNIASLPEFDELPNELEVSLLIRVGNNISTDEIMPAGTRILPLRSNIPKISEHCFQDVDSDYARRAAKQRAGKKPFHAIVAGENYGQGSSREHAALAPRYLGLRVVLAKSIARIHRRNLINFGILPLIFSDPEAYEWIDGEERLMLTGLHSSLREGTPLEVKLLPAKRSVSVTHDLSSREINILKAGSITEWMKCQKC